MDQTSVHIKQVTVFTPEIADEVRRLVRQIGKNYKELSDEEVKEMLVFSNNYLFVARNSESAQIAGMITLLVYRIPYTKKAVLDDLIVDGAFRNRGIGTLLLKKALETAKEKGAAYVDFTSRPARAEGNSLYEKLGFKKRETNIYRIVFNYGEV